MDKPRHDLRGKIFGRLFAITSAGKDKRGNIQWWVECNCGEFFVALIYRLLSGKTRSCGCLMRDEVRKRMTTHGQSGHGENGKSPAYRSWEAMKERCLNSHHERNHRNYGGRGIKVCERWMRFENFFSDMGERPPGLSIDRIDNDGNYEPGNCKWSTLKEQRKNRRSERED